MKKIVHSIILVVIVCVCITPTFSFANGTILTLTIQSSTTASTTPPVIPPIGPSAGGGGGGSAPSDPTTVLSRGNHVSSTTVPIQTRTHYPTFSQLVLATKKGKAPKRLDLYADGYIDVRDFNVLMINWAKKTAQPADMQCGQDKNSADINCDSTIDILDFNLMMVYWNDFVE